MTDEYQQIWNSTAEYTSNKSIPLSPKANKRRLEFIKYYYEIPTTAIGELIRRQGLRNNDREKTKNDDISLLHVNEIVNVEVCKYCSEIFTSKVRLRLHYNTKHNPRECNEALRTISLKKRSKIKRHTFKKHMHHKRQTYAQMLLKRKPIFNSLLDHNKYTKSCLFDAINFPNLHFMKQLDSCANINPALEKAKKHISITKETDNTHPDRKGTDEIEEEVSDADFETINDEFRHEKVDEEIKSVTIDVDYLSRSRENLEKTINSEYKWLNLKDFYISVERCVVPEEFLESTEPERAVSERKDSISIDTVIEKEDLVENTSIFDSRKTITDEMNCSATIPMKILAAPEDMVVSSINITKKTDGLRIDHSGTMTNSVNENKPQTFEDNLKRKMELVMNHKSMKSPNVSNDSHPKNKPSAGESRKKQHKPLILKDLYIPIRRCDGPIEFERHTNTVKSKTRKSEVDLVEKIQEAMLETSNITNKLKNIKRWKQHIPGTLNKLQQIMVGKNQDKSTSIELIDRIQDNGEPTTLKQRNCIDFQNTLLEDGIRMQVVQRNHDGILKSDQYKRLNLRDFHISLERSTLVEDFVQKKVQTENISEAERTYSGKTHDTGRKKWDRDTQTGNDEENDINHLLTMSKVESLLDIKIVIPKIDSLLKKKRYVEAVSELARKSGLEETSLLIELQRYSPVSKLRTDFSSNSMPELENEVANKGVTSKRTLEEPPQLDQQIRSAISRNPNHPRIFNNRYAKKYSKNLKSKLYKLRENPSRNELVTNAELEQIVHSLNLMGIDDDGNKDNNHDKVIRGPEPNSSIESRSVTARTDSCNESIAVTDLTLASCPRKKCKCKNPISGNGYTQCYFQSVIKSRWSKITNGKSNIVSEISNPGPSSDDLHNFAVSLVEKTLEDEGF